MESLNPFEDIFKLQNQRNKIVEKSNEIPIYFYRYIGIEDNQESYLEKLIEFQLKLKESSPPYVIVRNGLDKNF